MIYNIVDRVNLDRNDLDNLDRKHLEIREERIALFHMNGKMNYKVTGYVIFQICHWRGNRVEAAVWHYGQFLPHSRSRGELFNTLQQARETAAWIALGETQ